MSNESQFVKALKEAGGPQCDDCLAPAAGWNQRQQANQVGRRLEARGTITRPRGMCVACRKVKTISVLDGSSAELGRAPSTPVLVVPAARPEPAPQAGDDREWYWEGRVQSAVVAHLSTTGWRVTQVTDTASKAQGVVVLDLFAAFRAAAADGKAPVYCRTDTHWSGRGCEIAAAAIAAAVRDAGVPAGKLAFKIERRETEIEGDLAAGLTPPAPKEKLELGFVTGPDGAAPADDRASPVLLLGDSHVLVFHAGGDMHAQGAGLADLLAKELAAPLDVLGVRGSGATSCRVSLYRRSKADPAYLAAKKVVVWCFAEREFTEADGWRIVPVR